VNGLFELKTPQGKPIDIIHRYKITALLILSLTVGIYITLFGTYRIWGGRMIVGSAEITLGIFFLISFFVLRREIGYYQTLARIFFTLGYLLMVILTLYIPEERTHILWVPAIMVLIFFLLDYKGGILFLVSYILFVLYLAIAGYDYTVTEYITWIFSLIATSVVMYYYEKVKQIEHQMLTRHTEALQKEVEAKTLTLSEQNRTLQAHKTALEVLNNSLERRIQEALDTQTKQEQILLQQCRIGSMGEVLDSIAHQWRQPLMHINAVLMNLDREIEQHQHPSGYLEAKISEATTLTAEMSDTIEEFRSLFRSDKQISTFDINEAIDKALELYKSSLKEIHISGERMQPLFYRGYRNEITQVLLILLGNAVEALGQRETASRHIYLSLYADTEYLLLTIEDNAGGIDPDRLSLIFDPYFTTKKRHNGTGLGLYIAKIIIEQNAHGTLSAENSTRGARFTIKLRRAS